MDLETQNSSKQQTIIDLHRKIRELESSLSSEIVPKYLESLKEAADARSQMKKFEEQNEALRKRDEERDAELRQRDVDIRKLKEEKSSLNTELQAARTSLLASSIPAQAELAAKDEEIRALKTAIERQEKKVASSEQETGYARDAYQKATTAATEAMNELSAKEDLIKELTRKADDNRVLCARAQAQFEKEQTDQRILELEALLQDREEELDRRREEMRSKYSRRETRGSSVPRSPANSRVSVGVNMGGGVRSRGPSPSVGELSGMFMGRERDSEGLMAGSTKRIRQLQSD